MKPEILWRKFITEHHIENQAYDAYRFGLTDEQANELAALVKAGIKTATASAFPLYELEQSPLPEINTYSIILDAQEEAVCIVKNTKVYTQAYADITEEHAFKEGEGDRSLAYWREAHEAFFKQVLVSAGLTFDEQMLVVCEEFEVVYVAD